MFEWMDGADARDRAKVVHIGSHWFCSAHPRVMGCPPHERTRSTSLWCQYGRVLVLYLVQLPEDDKEQVCTILGPYQAFHPRAKTSKNNN